jgi:hypothetical protein
MNMEEIWKKIPEFPEEFEVSNFGRVRRLCGKYRTTYRGNVIFRTKRPKIYELKKLGTKGYQRINLLGRVWQVHRLVASAFIHNPNNLPQVNHKNGVKTDNSADNLEWVSNIENRRHAVAMGLHASGERCTQAKLTAEKVKQLRAMAGQYTQRQLASMFGLVQQTVSCILIGKTWKSV